MRGAGLMTVEIKDALKILIELFKTTSNDIAIASLCSKDRFKLIVETLMGHPRIRGTLRPRDLPLEPIWKDKLNLLHQLHEGLIPMYKTYKLPRTWNFGRWLQVFALCERSGDFLDNDYIKEEQNYSSACVILLSITAHVFMALPIIHTSVNTGHSKRIAHVIAESLGITQQEFEGRGVKNSVIATIARDVCIYINQFLDKHLIEFNNIKEIKKIEKCDRLDKLSFRIVAMKTVKVQSLIESCKHTFMTRGVSIWCTQFLAAIREYVQDYFSESSRLTSKALLITDAEVITRWFIPGNIDEKELKEKLKDYLNRHMYSDNGKKFFKRFIPRVMPWLESARNCKNNTHSVIPPLSLYVSNELKLSSLFETNQLSKEQWKAEEGDNIISFFELEEPKTLPEEAECSYVKGDRWIFDYDPPWWQCKKDKFGWKALVWGLAGAGHRRHLNTVLRIKYFRPEARSWVHHGDWLNSLKDARCKVTRLSYIKLDGDYVGKLFLDKKPIDRPVLSLKIRDQFERMVDSAMHACNERFESECEPHKINEIPFPVEIQYMGGDDMLFCIPTEYCQAFLAGVEKAWSKKPSDVESFSVCVVNMPEKPKNKGKTNSIATKLLMPGIKIAKNRKDSASAKEECLDICKNNNLSIDFKQLSSLKNGIEFKHIRGVIINMTE